MKGPTMGLNCQKWLKVTIFFFRLQYYEWECEISLSHFMTVWFFNLSQKYFWITDLLSLLIFGIKIDWTSFGARIWYIVVLYIVFLVSLLFENQASLMNFPKHKVLKIERKRVIKQLSVDLGNIRQKRWINWKILKNVDKALYIMFTAQSKPS